MSVYDNLIGQDHIISNLKSAVQASRLGEETQEMTHSWLFTGAPGSGRSTAAIAFAQALICKESGCGICSDCLSARSGAHPDVEIIRTEGLSIKVEEIRELLTRVAWAPSLGGWRVVVMEDADRLTEFAANALLKATEEPGSRTVWLLCAPALHDVLPTIRSRCRHLQLRSPSLEAVTNVLINVDQIASGMADFSARVSQSHIGRARYLATNEKARNNRKTIMQLPLQIDSLAAAFQAAQTLINIANQEAEEPLGDYAKKEKSHTTRIVRDSIDSALLEIATFFRDVILVQLGNSDCLINSDMREQIESYANSTPSHSIINKFAAIKVAREHLARNATPLTTCEALMCQLSKR